MTGERTTAVPDGGHKPVDPPEADADVQLMLRFQQDGDEAAFQALMERHRRAVMSTIYRYLGDAGDVEDLAQEAFLRVYRARHTYQPRARFKTWLFKIVVNLCLNEIRRRKVRSETSLEVQRRDGSGESFDLSDLVAAGDQDDPGRSFERREAVERLRDALGRLPEKQRMALLLAQQGDLSYKEIAAMMSSTVMSVKLRVHRARNRLREELGNLLS